MLLLPRLFLALRGPLLPRLSRLSLHYLRLLLLLVLLRRGLQCLHRRRAARGPVEREEEKRSREVKEGGESRRRGRGE
jgi:hypothetical protein